VAHFFQYGPASAPYLPATLVEFGFDEGLAEGLGSTLLTCIPAFSDAAERVFWREISPLLDRRLIKVLGDDRPSRFWCRILSHVLPLAIIQKSRPHVVCLYRVLLSQTSSSLAVLGLWPSDFPVPRHFGLQRGIGLRKIDAGRAEPKALNIECPMRDGRS